MKVIFDTNVLISGFLTATGPAQYVLGRALRNHTVLLSEYILKEFEEKLIHKLEVPRELVKQSIDFLRKRSILLEDPEPNEIKFQDKADIPILSLIQVSKAHYFVTGDKKLLSLKRMGPTAFISPREAMEIL